MKELNAYQIGQVSGAAGAGLELINGAAGAVVGAAAGTLLAGIQIGGMAGLTLGVGPMALAGALLGASFGFAIS